MLFEKNFQTARKKSDQGGIETLSYKAFGFAASRERNQTKVGLKLEEVHIQRVQVRRFRKKSDQGGIETVTLSETLRRSCGKEIRPRWD